MNVSTLNTYVIIIIRDERAAPSNCSLPDPSLLPGEQHPCACRRCCRLLKRHTAVPLHSLSYCTPFSSRRKHFWVHCLKGYEWRGVGPCSRSLRDSFVSISSIVLTLRQYGRRCWAREVEETMNAHCWVTDGQRRAMHWQHSVREPLNIRQVPC